MNDVTVNGSIWKFTTSFLAGVVLAGIAAYVSNAKDAVTRREFTEMEARYDQLLSKDESQVSACRDKADELFITVGKLEEDLKLAHLKEGK